MDGTFIVIKRDCVNCFCVLLRNRTFC